MIVIIIVRKKEINQQTINSKTKYYLLIDINFKTKFNIIFNVQQSSRSVL